MLKSRISSTKRTPARGALNIPATAAAAPQTRSTVILPVGQSHIAGEVGSDGGSGIDDRGLPPTDPPNPMVTELAATEDHILCGLILDSCLETA